MSECAYIFLDEGGNFDFSPSGTRYFVLASVATNMDTLRTGTKHYY